MMPEDACRSSMVSNNGTILMALRPDGLTIPTSFSSTATSSMSDMPLHMEMMHWEITSAPNLAWASAAARNSASSPSVSSLYLTKAELSGLALRSSLKQQIDAGFLVQRQIGHAGDRGIEQFRDRALMHRRILPDVEPGEMEAEAIHGAAQLPQTPPRDHAGIIRNQRTVEHVEIGLEFLYAFIRRCLADRTPCRLDLQLCGSRGQPGINSGHREAIRLAAAMRRESGERPASARNSSETSARCAASDSSAPSACNSSR